MANIEDCIKPFIVCIPRFKTREEAAQWATDGHKVATSTIANAVRAYLESPEVVERVAKALFDDQWLDDDGRSPCSWDDACEDEHKAWRRSARAALNAAGGKQDG